MPEAMLHTEDNQPVEPAPVDTMMPLEDWRSAIAPAVLLLSVEGRDERARHADVGGS